MKEHMLVPIIKMSSGKDSIIVGAGIAGKGLYEILKQHERTILEFWDNDDSKTGKAIDGIPIKKPYNTREAHCLFIIAIKSLKAKKELFAQLIELGVKEEDIICYLDSSDPRYIEAADITEYPDIINDLYFKEFGREIDLEEPLTYTEKLNWEKLHINDPIRTRLADKVEVRPWVREQIGERYLTKWYGVWDDPEEIDLEALPTSFVLKANNGSGRNILVKDKSKLDWAAAKKQLKEQNYAFTALELHYKDIVPKIICEEYLDGLAETVYDYNIYCFGGEPRYIWCIKGSHRPGCQASFYDLDWNMLPFSFGYPKDEIEAPRPEWLDEMLELSRKLCRSFKHVRVDWYAMPDGRVLFGEMTFSSWAGLHKFCPEKYDMEFGKLIKW